MDIKEKLSKKFGNGNYGKFVHMVLDSFRRSGDSAYSKKVDDLAKSIERSMDENEKVLRSDLDEIIGLLRDGYNIFDSDKIEKSIRKLDSHIWGIAISFIAGNTFLNIAKGVEFKGMPKAESK